MVVFFVCLFFLFSRLTYSFIYVLFELWRKLCIENDCKVVTYYNIYAARLIERQ